MATYQIAILSYSSKKEIDQVGDVTSRKLRGFCRRHSNYVAQHEETPTNSTFLLHHKNIKSHDMTFMSRGSDIAL